MSEITCPRCQGGTFEIHLTAFGVDQFDALGEERFVLDRNAIAQPDAVVVEAICRGCGHARHVPADQWEWA